jgi:maleate isomerase
VTALPYTTFVDRRPKLGMVVLQADETIEDEMRRLLPASVSLNTSRVPSGAQLTPESLGAMELHLEHAARLFPESKRFDVVAYACTSASAQLGVARVAELIRRGTSARHVTDPVSALLAACRAGNIRRLAFLSPYVEAVSNRLRDVLAREGIETSVFGSFNESEERRVALIDPPSLLSAGRGLLSGADVDALFVSCTNVKTFGVITELQRDAGLPVLSSNLVLGWHMLRLTGALSENTQAATLLETACPTATANIF